MRDVITPGERREAPDADYQAGLADRDAVDKRAENESEREAAPAFSERPSFSEEDVAAAQAALGLVGALGLLPPEVGLVAGADAARRSYKKLSPAEQYEANNLADSAVNLFGSMPAGTAIAVIGASYIGPVLHAKVQDIFHKMSRKD
jgi:hypothetical protein